MSAAVTWTRPDSPQFTKFCAVDANRSDADITRTHCGGSWPASTDTESIDATNENCCPACVGALPVSRALAELRDAPAIRTAELHTAPREGVLFEGFDISDEERDA